MSGKRDPFSITETFLWPQTSEEAPFSRRVGLQKTGSSGALGPADRRGAEGAPGAGLQRSASSSLLEGTATQVSGARGRGQALRVRAASQREPPLLPSLPGQGAPSGQNHSHSLPEGARALCPVSTQGLGPAEGGQVGSQPCPCDPALGCSLQAGPCSHPSVPFCCATGKPKATCSPPLASACAFASTSRSCPRAFALLSSLRSVSHHLPREALWPPVPLPRCPARRPSRLPSSPCAFSPVCRPSRCALGWTHPYGCCVFCILSAQSGLPGQGALAALALCGWQAPVPQAS